MSCIQIHSFRSKLTWDQELSQNHWPDSILWNRTCCVTLSCQSPFSINVWQISFMTGIFAVIKIWLSDKLHLIDYNHLNNRVSVFSYLFSFNNNKDCSGTSGREFLDRWHYLACWNTACVVNMFEINLSCICVFMSCNLYISFKSLQMTDFW